MLLLVIIFVLEKWFFIKMIMAELFTNVKFLIAHLINNITHTKKNSLDL